MESNAGILPENRILTAPKCRFPPLMTVPDDLNVLLGPPFRLTALSLKKEFLSKNIRHLLNCPLQRFGASFFQIQPRDEHPRLRPMG
jgi:hypothetical protein